MGFEEASALSCKTAGFVSQVQLGNSSKVWPYAGLMKAGVWDFKLTPVDLKVVVGPGALVPVGGSLAGLASGVDLKMLANRAVDYVKTKVALYRNHELKLKTLEVNTKQAVLKESYGAYQIEISQANPEPEEIAGESAKAVAKTTALLGMGMGALGFADLWESINRGVGGVGVNDKAEEILVSSNIAFLVPYYFLDKALDKATETSSGSSPANETPATSEAPGLYSLSCDTLLQNVDGDCTINAKGLLTEWGSSLKYAVGASELKIGDELVAFKSTHVTVNVLSTSVELKGPNLLARGPESSFVADEIDVESD